MRISVRHVATVAAIAGTMVGSVAVAYAATPVLIAPSGTVSGSLSESPSKFYVGDAIKLTANFADSQKGKTIDFLKETSPGSGDYASIGTAKANSSGNGSLSNHVVNETQKVFARTSAGKETEVDTLTPGVTPGDGESISACFDRDDGELRVAFPPFNPCTSSQKALSWNQQGIQGDKGDKG